MWNRRRFLPAVTLLLLLLLSGAGAALAADQEGCLFCHRLEIGKADGGNLPNLRVFDPPGMLHTGLYCSDCHPDARLMPHLSLPGSARCIGECHSTAAGPPEVERHRRASFGGLTEAHRKVALPGTPCPLCHRSADRAGDRKSPLSRCRGCHEGEYRSVREGVHGTLAAAGSEGMCSGCHVVHPTPGKGAGGDGRVATTCGTPACHARMTPAMKRFGGHGRVNGESLPSRRSRVAVFLAVAALGLIPGRILAVGRKGKGGGK